MRAALRFAPLAAAVCAVACGCAVGHNPDGPARWTPTPGPTPTVRAPVARPQPDLRPVAHAEVEPPAAPES
ncbi:MAG: DNA polymerase III subunit gamma/tau, partial [Planctomycetes bacterium]|nr:DNA polymerase III subunit gamma/tau [Planctomycetota bacterium]